MKAIKSFEMSVSIYKSQNPLIFNSTTAGNLNLARAECLTSLCFINRGVNNSEETSHSYEYQDDCIK